MEGLLVALDREHVIPTLFEDDLLGRLYLRVERIGMEACAGAHFLGRALREQGTTCG